MSDHHAPLNKLDPEFLAFVDDFRSSNGTRFEPRRFSFSWQDFFSHSENLALTGSFDALDVRLLVKAGMDARQHHLNYLHHLLHSDSAERVYDILIELDPAERPDLSTLCRVVFAQRLRKGELADSHHPDAPFEDATANRAWNIDDAQLLLALQAGYTPPLVHAALARYRPGLLTTYLAQLRSSNAPPLPADNWSHLIAESTRFDPEFLEAAVAAVNAQPASAYTMESHHARQMFEVLCDLNERREGSYLPQLLEIAARPGFSSFPKAVNLLITHRPDDAPSLVAAGLSWNSPFDRSDTYPRLFALALATIEGTSAPLFRIAIHSNGIIQRACLTTLLTDPPPEKHEAIRALILQETAGRTGKSLNEFWSEVASIPSSLLLPEFREFLVGKSKPLREIAAAHLAASDTCEALPLASELLGSKKIDERVGAVVLLGKLSTAEAIQCLQSAHATEQSKQVRRLIGEVLAGLGVTVRAEPETPKKEAPVPGSVAEFEAAIAKQPKSIKLPKAEWLNGSKLPPLYTRDGTELSELATTFVIQKQARGNKIALAPELEPLVPFLDRQKNAPFAHAVLDQWFASEQKANTQWALGLVGLTGDNAIIDRLLKPMEGWCEANRTALAQWAVMGISLLGTDEALATLDRLTQKFRSKRKYIGAAAGEAIVTTAEMRGISLDDLEDLVVPTFDFDAEGHRPFTTKDGTVHAVIQPDFKLAWFQPATEKETKTTPTNLTEDAKAELKDVRKFLRDAVKAQTARLERLMVQQRRWPVARWREIFEQQPLLLTFATRLVWGVYDSGNNLLRAFRRYPNGLLASATGELEELPESDTRIGLVHPLELEPERIEQWLAHLQRFKVKPPFPQLDRPVARLDPQHRNRKELTTAKGLTIPAGTLRSRCEKRGWSLGTTGDGGRIHSFYKQFPALEIEVYLEIEDFAAFSGFDDEITLHEALFARLDPDKRRAYLADEPNGADDPRVLTFGEVPAIVYSESQSDLNVITEGHS